MANVTLLALLLPTGCSDNTLEGLHGQASGVGPPPKMQIEPHQLDYGWLTADDEVVQSFTITNVGDEDSVLEISDIRIGGSEAFTLGEVRIGDRRAPVAVGDDFRLPGGSSAEVDVWFTPDHPRDIAGDTRVTSNDPELPTDTVDLGGNGIVPGLRITPDPLDMGTVEVGCTLARDLTLTNTGTFPITVSSVTQEGDGFAAPEFAPGLVIGPHGSETVKVTFTPATDVAYAGTFVAESDAEEPRTESVQNGAGAIPMSHLDHFDMPLDPPIDILFFVDESCSMRDDQTALADNFSAFISSIDRVTPDWHLVVATEDDGCAHDGVLTRDVVGYADLFRTAVSLPGGMWTEAGLTVATNAIENSQNGTCNNGFLRDEALLHVIMVSDEAEQSSGSWDTWLARMQTAKGDPLLLKVSAVAGDFPSGCRTTTNSALAGFGYYETVMATGGVYLSLCSSWSDHVNLLSDATIAQDTFTLSNPADPDTIVATINGTTVTDWRWDPTRNAVIFRGGSGPGEGDTVDFSYREPAVCE